MPAGELVGDFRRATVSVHRLDYAARVEALALHGGGRIEGDTVVSGDSYDVARLAAGAVADAVDRVVKTESKTALCLVRLLGHHALNADAMGFCLFNNVRLGCGWRRTIINWIEC